MTDRHAGSHARPPGPRTMGAGTADPTREQQRQQALREYRLPGDEPMSRPELHSLVALAADACGVSMATLNLLTEDHQHQLESVGFTGSVTPRADSMCAVVVDETEPLVLADARSDERFRENPWVTAPDGVRFYATFQLRTPAEVPIGSLCVFDPEPRVIDDAQRHRLATLAERVVDVLELELRGRRLRNLNAELAAANARLARFAQTVSHDLRTPLTSLELTLDVAGFELEADRLEEAAALILRARGSAARMASIVDLLLAQAREAVTALAPVPLDDVVADVRDDLRTELAGLDLTVASPLPSVLGHADALRVVLQNLLVNVTQHAAGHDPRACVEAEVDAGWCHLFVVDHGPGVPEADRERVFDLGQQATSTHGPRSPGPPSGGHGIGLASSRQLVEAMGGTLTLRPTRGGGATFVVSLPVPPSLSAAADDADADADADAGAQAVQTTP